MSKIKHEQYMGVLKVWFWLVGLSRLFHCSCFQSLFFLFHFLFYFCLIMLGFILKNLTTCSLRQEKGNAKPYPYSFLHCIYVFAFAFSIFICRQCSSMPTRSMLYVLLIHQIFHTLSHVSV